MSDILIKGMDMPVFEHQSWDIRRGADGKWYVTDTNAETSDGAWHELVPVPPHGRLTDADALEDNNITYYAIPVLANVTDTTIREAELVIRLKDLDAAPTIIPASEEVYDKYTDTAGNFHWTGTKSGAHIIPAEEGET